ncbi:hypothetical protein [Nocardiopsis sp. MG754419]|uniref:MoaF-related domain-containing protein n=1 Tax=Nocardiopsis sp. MG754419 TaxID=2259865 RepID=UPI0035B2681F
MGGKEGCHRIVDKSSIGAILDDVSTTWVLVSRHGQGERPSACEPGCSDNVSARQRRRIPGVEKEDPVDRAAGRPRSQIRSGPAESGVHLRLAVAGRLRRGGGRGLAPDGHAETVALDLTRLREGLYLNSWTEASGATVTHVEDFANGVSYSNVTVDGLLFTFVGTIRETGP